jgi:two-component system, sensor histidine kinase and response regulator
VDELSSALRIAELFAAVLGHDLRTPLSVIMLSGELLRRHPSDMGVREQAERVLTNGRHMARMIEELLDLSRARLAGGIPLVRKRIDLVALCVRVIDEHRLTSPERRIDFEFQGDGVGLWDEDRLVQLLSNLLTNALRHGEPGGRISAKLDAVRAEEVQLELSNRGAIPSEILPHLFDPFVSHRERNVRRDGLGLGLYIVQQIARAHAGTIRVESDAVHGTRFIVCLPRTTDAG